MYVCVCVCKCVPQDSDVGKDVAGQKTNSESAREVATLLVATVAQMNSVLQLLVIGVGLKSHLTQEGIFDDIVVPNLSAEKESGRGGEENYKSYY